MNLGQPFLHIVRWSDSRLQRKFVLILAAILLFTSVAFLLMVVTAYKNRLVEEHARASMQVNRLLQTSLENAMLKRDIPGLREIVEKLGTQQGIANVMIVNPDLEIRFSSNAARLGGKLDRDSVKKSLISKTQQTRLFSNTNGVELLRSINPVHNRKICKECHGDAKVNPINGLLIVDYEAKDIKLEALNSALLLAGFGSFVMLATGMGIWLTLNWLVLSRLSILRQTSRKLANGQLDARARLKGHDEIADLGASFDRMADRLGETLAGLNAAENFLQNVIDAIPDGMRVIDDDFNIIKANSAYCRQTGQNMSEVIGEKCYRSSHRREEPCPVTLISCPLFELRNSDTSFMKARHQHKSADGGELFVEISAARVKLIVNGKETPCIIESIRDLAEQANISHEQRLSEIGLLATGVAHEIHNPLSSIQLALKAIQADLENSSDCQTNFEYFDIAETEIAKCLKVTDGLMMLSEPPGDMVSLIALDEIIPDVFSLLSYQSEQANISVNLDLAKGLRIVASDSDMRMIVINLAQNGFHAMPDGGEFTVTGRHVGAMIELVFSDTGLGIPQTNLEKIFLPFWTKRIDASEGRGLGLSICKAIIDRFDGTIKVESKVGSGTQFTILLPSADVDG